MTPLYIGWMDVLLVTSLVASIAFGFHQGLVRQIVLLVSLYISTILAAQYNQQTADLLIQTFPSAAAETASLLSFLALVALFAMAVTWLLWSAYCETRLPSVFMLDEMGGAVLGGVIGVFVINLTLVLLRYALQAPWPEGGPFLHNLQMGLLNSSLQSAFSSPMPLVYATLRPWLPFGIPGVLGS